MKILTFSILLFVLSGCPVYCPGPQFEISVQNHSDSAIYICQSCTDSIPLEPELKLFWVGKPGSMKDELGANMGYISSPDYRIDAYKYNSVALGVNLSADEKTICPGRSKATFFIIKESVMRKYTWKEIVQMQMYQKKIHLTKQQLDRSN